MGRHAWILTGSDSALDWVENMAAKFAHHRNDSNWETLTQGREIACICALFKVHTGERASKAIGIRQISENILL
jgi:hypothetical protein